MGDVDVHHFGKNKREVILLPGYLLIKDESYKFTTSYKLLCNYFHVYCSCLKEQIPIFELLMNHIYRVYLLFLLQQEQFPAHLGWGRVSGI